MKKIFLSLFVLFGAVNSSFAVEIPDVMRKTMAQDPIGATGILQLIISNGFCYRAYLCDRMDLHKA